MVGYILLKKDGDDSHPIMSIVSLEVKYAYRRRNIATQLFRTSVNAAIEVYKAQSVIAQLPHVSESFTGFLLSLGFREYQSEVPRTLYEREIRAEDLINPHNQTPGVDVWYQQKCKSQNVRK